MRELISYAAYLVDRERIRSSRLPKSPLRPPERLPEEESRCFSCGADLSSSELFQRYRVCERCGFHHNISAWERIYLLVDPGSFQEAKYTTNVGDMAQLLGNTTYQERVREAQRRTHLSEAAVCGTCTIGGNPTVLAVLDCRFLGGNMGVVVGDRVARAFEMAVKKKLPIVTVVSSGGSRIEEGVLSLVQMAKTVASAKRLQEKRLPHISVLTHPTTGEVYASFPNLSDIIIAEPGAMIGFAPIRAVEQAEGEEISQMDHTAESHLAHGMIDQIADRTRVCHLVSTTLDLLSFRYRLGPRKKVRPYFAPTHPQEQAWQAVELARHEERPTAADYISRITSTFIELHGDRSYSDDPSIVCGLAELGGEAVVVIGQQRDRGGGHTAPEGFRKAERAMRLAAKSGLPLINLIDTPGASPGSEAEERGIGHAIASAMAVISDLRTPVISVVIGQGGSEGALALAIADRVLMMENAYLSVISPERAASIFYRDVGRAKEFASALKLTAEDCKKIGLVDVVVPEPESGAHTHPEESARVLKNLILRELLQIQSRSPDKLVKSRYKRFRYIGTLGSPLRRILSKQTAQIQSLIETGMGGLKQRLASTGEKNSETGDEQTQK